MEQETFQEAFNFIERKLRKEMFNQPGTEVSFFGGEPLLNLNLMENIRYSPSIRYVMPTNAILLNNDVYENLILKNNINIGISYDGSYGNTYNRLLKSSLINDDPPLGSISRYDSFHFSLMKKYGCKTMLYPNTFQHLKEIYLEFKNNEIQSDFTLIRDNIYLDKDIENYEKALEDLTEYLILSNEKTCIPGIYRLWISKFLNARFGRIQHSGCFAGINGVGIKPNGNIYPCIRFSDHIISDIRTGKINHDVLEFFRENLPSKIDKCRKCDIFGICSSQCFYTSLKNGGWKKVEPIESVCRLFRISLRESMKLLRNMPTLDIFNGKI